MPSIDDESALKPKLRLSAIILNKDRVLLGNIKNGVEKNVWTFPEGEFEIGESYHRCFFRNLWRDLAWSNTYILELNRNHPSAVTSDIYENEKFEPFEHYMTLYFRGEYKKGRSIPTTQSNFSRFNWFEWNKFPEQLSLPLRNLLKQNYNPFS